MENATRAARRKQEAAMKRNRKTFAERKLQIMRQAKFVSTVSDPWIAETRIRMIQIIHAIQWRTPCSVRNGWSFSRRTGSAGCTFKEPLAVALFISETWKERWSDYVLHRRKNATSIPPEVLQALEEISDLNNHRRSES
jgi:hypothetical protein